MDKFLMILNTLHKRKSFIISTFLFLYIIRNWALDFLPYKWFPQFQLSFSISISFIANYGEFIYGTFFNWNGTFCINNEYKEHLAVQFFNMKSHCKWLLSIIKTPHRTEDLPDEGCKEYFSLLQPTTNILCETSL